MTEQERKKKITEIREWHEGKRDSFPQFTVFEAVGVMLDELDRTQQEYAEERAAHNAHVTELCELEQERDKLIEGLNNYMKELNRRSQKAYRNYDIDCDHHRLGMAEAYEVAERRLRDILKEIGVTVE